MGSSEWLPGLVGVDPGWGEEEGFAVVHFHGEGAVVEHVVVGGAEEDAVIDTTLM